MIHFKMNILFKIFAIIYAIEYGGAVSIPLLGEQKAAGCAQDWRPCSCIGDSSTISGRMIITCDGTSILDVIEVFDRTNATNLIEFNLEKFKHDEVGIPDYILGNTYVESDIRVECAGDLLPLHISENAFYPAKKTSNGFALIGCNLSNSSMGFLEGFNAAKMIAIDTTSGLGHVFSSFPIRLPKLNMLMFNGGIGWETLMISPKPLEAELLTRFYVTGSIDMTDEAMDIIMNWAAMSFNSTLESLYIFSNNLTKIPRQIESFDRLGVVELRGNHFPLVLSRSLVMKAEEVFLVTMSDCNIYEIQPDAFQGNFKNTAIELQGNKLSRFESSVFHKILQEGGNIDVKENPFNCEDDPCHLAWLFNENLLNLAKNAQCSNGTYFEDLDLSYFAECKLYTTTESSLSTEKSTQSITISSVSFIWSISWSRIGESSPTGVTEGNVATIQTTNSLCDLSTNFDTTVSQDTSALVVSLTSWLPPLSPSTNYASGIHPLMFSPISIFFYVYQIVILFK